MDGDARVGGGVDPDQFVTAKLVDLFVEEVERPADDGALEAGRAVHRRRDDDVVGGPGEHRFGLLEWLAPPPPLDDARVARGGERPLAEVGADQQRVLVFPGGLRLGLVQLEAAVDEGAGGHVELPHHRGVRTAGRQADQRALVVGFDDGGPGPHPVPIVGARQLVDVDDHVPVRLLGAVAVQRGPPPQAPLVGRVPPEVVEVVAAAPHVRDPGVGVEHLQGFGAQLLEPVAGQFGDRRLVVLVDPRQRLVAGDVLEPQVRIGRVVVARRGVGHAPILRIPVGPVRTGRYNGKARYDHPW